ncbi:hypothetical protein B0H13DRAFT_1891649 [Mycena leptocephala]|nr:hypothetical protein B0H13DRAFT_1891649 [Mycena leptocephala]
MVAPTSVTIGIAGSGSTTAHNAAASDVRGEGQEGHWVHNAWYVPGLKGAAWVDVAPRPTSTARVVKEKRIWVLRWVMICCIAEVTRPVMFPTVRKCQTGTTVNFRIPDRTIPAMEAKERRVLMRRETGAAVSSRSKPAEKRMKAVDRTGRGRDLGAGRQGSSGECALRRTNDRPKTGSKTRQVEKRSGSGTQVRATLAGVGRCSWMEADRKGIQRDSDSTCTSRVGCVMLSPDDWSRNWATLSAFLWNKKRPTWMNAAPTYDAGEANIVDNAEGTKTANWVVS